MRALYEWLAAASVWWWPRFADHLWQTTAFALVILVAAFMLRRGPAHWRHTFCLVASAKFILPAALFVFLAEHSGLTSLPFLSSFQRADQNALLLSGITGPAATFTSTYEVTVGATSLTRHPEFYFALTTIWLTGMLTLLLLWGIRRRRFLNSMHLGKISWHGRERQALERARESLQWKGKVALVISPLKLEPAVWRVWRPTLILPENIASHLDDDELEAIMLHELVHIQRRDNLISDLQLALCALLWFHPLVWFINRKLFDEREQVCDERVMEVCRAPEAYASSILKVVRFCFGWRMAGVTGAASGTNLRRRIENIMSTGNSKRRTGVASRLFAVGLVGMALLILVAAGVYSRPRASNALTNDTGALRTTSNQVSLESEMAADQQSSKKAAPSPPSPSSPPTDPSQSAPPQPPQPAQPPQPNEPNEPGEQSEQAEQPDEAEQAEQAEQAEPAEEEEKDFHKADKEKWKEKRDKIKKGELIEAPRPAYPDEIKKQQIEGTVVVVITIGNDGNVIYAKAKSGPEELYEVSEAAAMKARFKPTILEGKPVKVTGVMSYDFVLDK
jgi:TonB family protein